LRNGLVDLGQRLHREHRGTHRVASQVSAAVMGGSMVRVPRMVRVPGGFQHPALMVIVTMIVCLRVGVRGHVSAMCMLHGAGRIHHPHGGMALQAHRKAHQQDDEWTHPAHMM
jgi:hypothetical protein